MKQESIVLEGKYKGYKLIFDENNNSIKLISRKEIIDLKGKVKSVCIKGNKSDIEDETMNVYYFEIREDEESIKCLTTFKMYLRLMIYGMKVPLSCLGI